MNTNNSTAQLERTNAASTPHDPAWPSELAGLLHRVRGILETEGADKALELIGQQKENSPWLTNTFGVCLLRQGQYQRALELFRGLVGGGFSLRDDVPTRFAANYAVAQLLCGMESAAAITLSQARNESDPFIQKVRAGIRRWERSLPFSTRMRRLFGGDAGPVVLDFPPGEL